MWTIAHNKRGSPDIQGFNQSEQRPLEKSSSKLGSTRLRNLGISFSSRLIVNDALLGHPWKHKNAILPSTFHHCIKFPLRVQGTIFISNHMFPVQKPTMLMSIFCKVKSVKKRGSRKRKVLQIRKDPISWRTQLSCKDTETYHQFEVSKRGETSKLNHLLCHGWYQTPYSHTKR